MLVKEAVKIIKNKYPEKVIVGYCQRKEGIFFRTKILTNSLVPGFVADIFVVSNSGDVEPTTVFISGLSEGDFKKCLF